MGATVLPVTRRVSAAKNVGFGVLSTTLDFIHSCCHRRSPNLLPPGSEMKQGRIGLTHLHQGKLLLAGVVVSGGALVFLGVVGALLVGVLVRGMNQFPGVLRRKVLSSD